MNTIRLSLLIIFALLGLSFHNILENQINQFGEKVDDNSHLKLVTEKLEDQLTLDSTIAKQEKSEKPSCKKLNFLPPSKFWGIGSLAVLAIGGSSLLRIQSIQNSYKRVNTSPVNIQTENQSKKSLLSMLYCKFVVATGLKFNASTSMHPILLLPTLLM